MTEQRRTYLTHAGRKDKSHYGSVNTPVIRASTQLFPNTTLLKEANGTRLTYGRHGTETTFALEDALCAVEGADACFLAPSGLSAVTTALLAFLKPGDHLLMTDSVYDPTRSFCDGFLQQIGVSTTYYDPSLSVEALRVHLQPNTKVIFVESPGSLTFEMQDIPAIKALAQQVNALVIADNTWATPMGWRPFDKGVDVSIHAATKYIVGHSDVLMGVMLCKKDLEATLRATYRALGLSVSGDDAYLALRGLRTLASRLQSHTKNAMEVALWLQSQAQVKEVLYPPLPGAKGHDIWVRDFDSRYVAGLMGVVFHDGVSQSKVNQLIDRTKYFGIGYSWGGFESLMIPVNVQSMRSITQHNWNNAMARLHIGLEAPEDLIADLTQAWSALNA